MRPGAVESKKGVDITIRSLFCIRNTQLNGQGNNVFKLNTCFILLHNMY